MAAGRGPGPQVTSSLVWVNRLRPLYRRWLPVALAVTAAANLVAHVFVPLTAQPLRLHDEGSLTYLVHTEQRVVDLRYGFYEELADVMAGQTLLVPEGSPVDMDLASGLSGVTVVIGDFDPAAPSVAELIDNEEPIGLLQVGEGEVPYWILAGADDQLWWLALAGGGIVVVPESVEPVPGANA